MPEGHIVEMIARQHSRSFGGQVLRVSSPQGRFARGAQLIDGRLFLGASAYGKHSFHRFAHDGARAGRGDLFIHVHLGLYGKWSGAALPVADPVGAVRLQLVADNEWAQLRGASTCELLGWSEVRDVRERLGEDPLHSKENGQRAFARFRTSSRAIGLVLMDQSVVAGVGNVYRAEMLFRHGLSPYTPARSIDEALWRRMWLDLVNLMRAGVRAGRIVTTHPRDRSRRTGRPRSDDQYYVYRRAGLSCRRCGDPIHMTDLATRKLYWCPTCQR